MHDFDLYEQAMLLAVLAHDKQRRKFKDEPYVAHPIRVAIRAAALFLATGDYLLEERENGLVRVKIAALLHDVVEDSAFGLAGIQKQFGRIIADAVDHLSKRAGEEYSVFVDRCSRDPIALYVKIADIEDNLSDLPEHMTRQREKYELALAHLKAKLP